MPQVAKNIKIKLKKGKKSFKWYILYYVYFTTIKRIQVRAELLDSSLQRRSVFLL